MLTWAVEIFAGGDVVNFTPDCEVQGLEEVPPVKFSQGIQSDVSTHYWLIRQDYGRLVCQPALKPEKHDGAEKDSRRRGPETALKIL